MGTVKEQFITSPTLSFRITKQLKRIYKLREMRVLYLIYLLHIFKALSFSRFHFHLQLGLREVSVLGIFLFRFLSHSDQKNCEYGHFLRNVEIKYVLRCAGTIILLCNNHCLNLKKKNKS